MNYELLANAFKCARKDIIDNTDETEEKSQLRGLSLAQDYLMDILTLEDPNFDRDHFIAMSIEGV